MFTLRNAVACNAAIEKGQGSAMLLATRLLAISLACLHYATRLLRRAVNWSPAHRVAPLLPPHIFPLRWTPCVTATIICWQLLQHVQLLHVCSQRGRGNAGHDLGLKEDSRLGRITASCRNCSLKTRQQSKIFED